jgi:glycerol-3-phosphate acyltransferase PlsY
MIIEFVLSVVVAYLIGSLNASILYTRITGAEDIRKKGSGNAGMTNMLRNNGAKSAAIVFLGDVLKGILAVVIVRLYTDNVAWMCCAAFFVVIGHIFPVYFGFKGGKGVATAVASAAALPHGWLIAIILMVIFIPAVAITRMVSVSVLIATATYPLWVYIFTDADTANFIYSFIIVALIFIAHRANIVRLINGTENKIGGKKQ